MYMYIHIYTYTHLQIYIYQLCAALPARSHPLNSVFRVILAIIVIAIVIVTEISLVIIHMFNSDISTY